MIKNGLATNWLLGRSWNNKFITNVWQRSRYKNNTTHIPSHRIYLITEQYFNVVWNVYILYEVIQGYKRKKKCPANPLSLLWLSTPISFGRLCHPLPAKILPKFSIKISYSIKKKKKNQIFQKTKTLVADNRTQVHTFTFFEIEASLKYLGA